MEIKKTKLLSAQPLTSTVTATESLVKVDSDGKVTRIALSRLRDAILGGADVNCMLDGVFIMYHRRNDGTPLMVKPHKWKALQNSGEIADGVAVVDGGHVLVVAPTEASSTGLPWSSANIAGGGVAASSNIVAMKDFDGKENTASVISRSSATATTNTAAFAPGYCNLYSRTNAAGQGLTAGKWWLPSVGELMLIYANMSKINYCLGLISGATPLQEYWYWSSTEYNPMHAWFLYLDNGFMRNTPKSTSMGRVRAVSTFIQ